MFLRSGPDWHLDAAGQHTFAAFFEHRRPRPRRPATRSRSRVFLDHTDWFVEQKALAIRRRSASTRLAAIGVRLRARSWRAGAGSSPSASSAPPASRAFNICRPGRRRSPAGVADPHLRPRRLRRPGRDARLLIVGGRQSAYEWAALAADHGAARVDVVHRHPMPASRRSAGASSTRYVDSTLAERGWWRSLPPSAGTAIARAVLGSGPPDARAVVDASPPAEARHPLARDRRGRGEPTKARGRCRHALRAERRSRSTASSSPPATRPHLANLPYLAPLLDDIVSKPTDSPALDPRLSRSSVPGLYFIGFAATRDFGPFFGFTKGAPRRPHILVDALIDRA